MATPIITQQQVRRLFNYDPDTGVFTRLIRTANCNKAGDIVGYNQRPYLAVEIQEQSYLLHRLAFLWMTGEFPLHSIDHINGISTDNRWSNLRAVTHAQNLQNERTARSNNKNGFLGVSEHHRLRGRFQARITISGKRIYLGLFNSAEDAHAAYLSAKRKYHPFSTI